MNNKIRIYGDRVLGIKAREVGNPDEVKGFIPEMVSIMKELKGLGLAAPQIGKAFQVFIVDLELLEKGKGVKEFINPRLIYYEGEEIFEEGCLSMPGLYLEIPRPSKVVIEYFDMDMKINRMEAEGLFARVLLHEYDHVNGILIVDRLPEKEKKIMIAKWRKLWREMQKENSG
jgi:peptide deformylase